MAGPDELVRLTLGADSSLVVGRSAPGRGAWLCAGAPGCLELALRRRSLERALRGPISPDSIASLASNLERRACEG